MTLNWLVIVIVAVAAILLIVFLIWRNQKDQKDLMKKIIEEDEAAIPKDPDTEVENSD